MKQLRELWRTLGISIYEGERLKQNLRTFAIISFFMEIPALSGVFVYFNTEFRPLSIGCLFYFCMNLRILYLAVIKKDRKRVADFTVLMSLILCTGIIFFAKNGFAAHWTLLYPLIISYVCGVRIGITSSAYLTVLIMILYWSPLKALHPGGYPPIFLLRFPLLYLVNSFVVASIMIEYHLGTLKQIQYEKELEEACQAARAANLAKSEFLASMSHEIRTPLNAVLGINTLILRESQQALKKLNESPEDKAMFTKIISHSGSIDSAGNSLLSLINDILDFSKIEAGKIELSEGIYKLSSVLNDASNMIILRAKAKNLDFQIDVDETLPDVYCGDEMRLREMLQNLLTNAVKYTDKGSVKFSIKRFDDSKNINPGENLSLKFSVQDTGIGIKPEDEEKLFKRFERLDLNHNSTIEGTGLGLAITYKICEMMGGSIRVQSEYGKGSTFTLIIPQKVISCEAVGNFHEKFEKSIQGTEHYSELFKAPDAEILIVDDTKFNLLVAVGLLEKTEIKITTATGGGEAIDLARENKFDLILMDNRMPGIDGTQALNKIREFNKDIPVICLTADAISGARAKYLSQGFTDYLTKPIDGIELEKMLLKYLPPEKILENNNEYKNGEELKVKGEELNILRENGFDVEQALRYSQNDENLYKNLLKEYVLSSNEKINSLKKFSEARDLQNYGITVHALKSSSKMIGAMNFSAECLSLEQAANNNDVNVIQEKNSSMLNHYEKILSVIKSAIIFNPDDNIKNYNDEDEILEFLPE